MRTLVHVPHATQPARVVAPLAAVIVMLLVALVASAAIAQGPAPQSDVVLEANHFPPLLTVPGERSKLVFDVDCVPDDGAAPDATCGSTGSLFVRRTGARSFDGITLRPDDEGGVTRLAADVPDAIATNRNGFEYYAELESDDGGRQLVVPPAGSASPYRSLPLSRPVEVHLGAHAFGSFRRGQRIASSQWGNGPNDVGLEHGRNLGPIGASSFDVDSAGTVFILDEAHHRLLRWTRGAGAPARVPVPVAGRLADMTVERDSTVYVLESVGVDGQNPLVRRFDDTGRELDVVETAERSPSAIRNGPAGPVVLEHPAHQWMPVASRGAPIGLAAQRRLGSVGQPTAAGVEVVVLRTGNELRLAIVSSDRVLRAWRITSVTPLGEVQLAAPFGSRLVAVVRVYTDTAAEFRVLVLDRHGLVQQFSAPAADWAETAPLSRFRLVGSSLYQLGSDATRAFVDRYDLEVP